MWHCLRFIVFIAQRAKYRPFIRTKSYPIFKYQHSIWKRDYQFFLFGMDVSGPTGPIEKKTVAQFSKIRSSRRPQWDGGLQDVDLSLQEK